MSSKRLCCSLLAVVATVTLVGWTSAGTAVSDQAANQLKTVVLLVAQVPEFQNVLEQPSTVASRHTTVTSNCDASSVNMIIMMQELMNDTGGKADQSIDQNSKITLTASPADNSGLGTTMYGGVLSWAHIEERTSLRT